MRGGLLLAALLCLALPACSSAARPSPPSVRAIVAQGHTQSRDHSVNATTTLGHTVDVAPSALVVFLSPTTTGRPETTRTTRTTRTTDTTRTTRTTDTTGTTRTTDTTGTTASTLQSDLVERELQAIPSFSVGIMSTSQGAYTTAQFLLDITQGARVSNSSYKPSRPPSLSLVTDAQSEAVISGGQVQQWPAVLARAHSAPQLLEPGSLATHIPGGGAYVPALGIPSADGVLAADRNGHVANVWVSREGTLSAIDRLRAHHRLIVADLPSGPSGYADLRELAATRPKGELLIAIQRILEGPNSPSAGNELLWSALAGAGRGGQALSSQTTNERGLIASIDLAPTILDHLGLPIPSDMRGRPIHTDGALKGSNLRSLKARFEVIGSRRLPAILFLIAAWGLLLVAVSLPNPRSAWGESTIGAVDRATHATRAQRGGPWALRTGALAVLWAPTAVLLPAALEPTRTVEFIVLVATCFLLGGLTDRFIPWPRAPIAPAVTALVAFSLDALAGTQLLVRSVLGPDPILGARFYGIGNELKSALAVLVFAAVAGALYPAVRSRRAAMTMACAGILLAVVEGSARIGAGVGGVILVSAGTAVATVMLLPGGLNRKRVLIVMTAPIVGLIVLAALDLATAHGSGHFTGSVLDARSAGDIKDIIVRRYSAAWRELENHFMPFATAFALLVSILAVRRHERVTTPVNGDPAWLAALAGGLTAGAIGASSEDSGPVLLVVAVLMLGCVLSYLWGKPPVAEASGGAVSALASQHDLVH